MTIIAWDGKTLASDSLTVGGYMRQNGRKKIFTLNNGAVVGLAGDDEQTMLALEWLNNQGGDKPDPSKLCNISIIMIKNDISYELYELLMMDESGSPIAVGSGSCYAMGAMLHGATAEESVEISIKLDFNCGGEIQSMRVIE